MSTEVEINTLNNKALSSIATLKSGSGIYSTIPGGDRASKLATLKALTSPLAIADTLGTVINLRNIVAQATEVNDAATGTKLDTVRIILIDEDGTAYAAVSEGIMNSLRNIFAVMGEPSTWTEPLPVVAKEEKGSVAGRKFFTLGIAD